WSWAQELWSEPDIHEIAHTWFTTLDLLTTHTNQPHTGGHTPSTQRHYRDNSRQALEVLLPLKTFGTRTPLFFIHPVFGFSWCYHELADLLGVDRPIYGLQSRGIAQTEPLPITIEDIVVDYLNQIRLAQPKGPYNILGWSFGGRVAHMIATKLQDQGERVTLLAIFDEYPNRANSPEYSSDVPQTFFGNLGRELGIPEGESLDESCIVDALRKGRARPPWNTVWAQLREDIENVVARVVNVTINNAHLAQGFRPGRFDGNLLLFSAALDELGAPFTPRLWTPYITGEIENHAIDCRHHDMLQPMPVTRIGQVLAEKLAMPASTYIENPRSRTVLR
ncbi:MAG: alpha/beta fold hydrolase, partial [Pseudonocardia sp.]